jgi:thiosulfate reductase cytochrome b subunit
VVGFVVVHLMLVLLVPRTLPPMVTGRARRSTHRIDHAHERTRA